MKIGILGAGFVGRAIAKLAIASGHQVMLSNSRGPQSLFSLRPMIGCEVGTSAEASEYGEVVVVAVPLHALADLPAQLLAAKHLLDAVNYYPERDGEVALLESQQITTSELLGSFLPGARITKAFNAIPMTDLENGGLPAGNPARRALPLAGDDAEGKKIAAKLYDEFGFDSFDVGGLAEGWRFERGMPCYCVRMTKGELQISIERAQR
ncbi:NADPH-dependent F420 reductase [Erwinia amylovora]